MRIAFTGIGIAAAALFVDWIAGPHAAVAFAFFGLWALLLTLSRAFATGPRVTPDVTPDVTPGETLAEDAAGGPRITEPRS